MQIALFLLTIRNEVISTYIFACDLKETTLVIMFCADILLEKLHRQQQLKFSSKHDHDKSGWWLTMYYFLEWSHFNLFANGSDLTKLPIPYQLQLWCWLMLWCYDWWYINQLYCRLNLFGMREGTHKKVTYSTKLDSSYIRRQYFG